jgi:cell surface protein SprA
VVKEKSRKKAFYFFSILSLLCMGLLSKTVNAYNLLWLHNNSYDELFIDEPETIVETEPIDYVPPAVSPDDIFGDSDPPGITTEIHYDPQTNQYYVIKKAGDRIIGRPYYMGFDEYVQYDLDRALRKYWDEKSKPQSFDRGGGVIPQIHVGSEVFDKIFGGGTIDIRPTGSAELIFGILSNYREDPSIDEKRRTVTNFDFQPKIQLSVQAKVGEKIEINSTYSTEATFDFENKMKVEYRGTEDEILQLIEAGDVTLPLPGTLIRGSQGLFGFKTQLRFGKTTVTSVFSQQKTEAQTIEVSGGAQRSEFIMKSDQYEDNRHFFIAQYFRDRYDDALSSLPIVRSSVNITRIEVWVTNVGSAVEDNRNIVAFADLGEVKPYNPNIISNNIAAPTNGSNQLYANMSGQESIRNISLVNSYLQANGYNSGTDYENLENSRRLRNNEYTFNQKLGFISLNQTINPDQVLAIAFQYTIIGDTTTYQVGEFSNEIDAPKSLIVKLLKSTAIDTRLPMWNLMMKNVYNIGAFQINRDEFRLNILYENEDFGVPMGFFNEGPVSGQPIIRVMGLDNLNTLLDPNPDGVFDFIDFAATQGGTIQSSNGRIFFPVIEPFGSHLRKMLEDPALGDKYAYDSLYTTTKDRARQFPERNRFILEGFYKSASGSEIALNAINIPQGSVSVTAGGVPLTENIDYTVDYTLGRVQIINEGILNSGTPIRISLESSTFFNIQTKTLLGTHIDHKISDNFNIGATILNLSERPLTQKVNYGDEPISNTIWGLNTTYSTKSLFLTKALDLLPFYSSTTPSNITFNGEFAHLIPGHSRHIGSEGTAYIDDFEGSKSSIDLKNVQSWAFASTPQHQIDGGMFPEGAPGTDLAFRFNVAKLAWYIIDPLFTRNNNLTPAHIRSDLNQQSNHYVREVMETEIWPNKENPSGFPGPIPVFNMAFYPSERGPYNYDVAASPFSRGVAQDGNLIAPETRWGGVMRGLPITDFEAANVEYIEFWLLDPFIYNPEHSGGYLYFNLGDVSEDVLRDGRKSFENGLPISDVIVDVDTTIWGRVPNVQSVVDAFDNNPESRIYQDVGLDGLSTEDEKLFFNDVFLAPIKAIWPGSMADSLATADPSSDKFKYFRSTKWDQMQASILERYKYFNLPEGNSPTAEMSEETYPTQATPIPNNEDINRDGTLNENERYFQYRISLRPQDMVVGQNYISDVVESTVRLKNEETETVKWYQFKIPLRDPNRQAVNNIQDFKSIRFMRLFYKGFTEPVFCRFATFELVRGTWRIYDRDLSGPGEYIPIVDSQTAHEVFTVNIEENGTRFPVPYVIPPGIEREVDMGQTTMHQRNEQSLAMRVNELQDGDARAVYKTLDMDMRQYKRLKMFTHAEAVHDEFSLNDDDVTVFIRLGTDFSSNYYEYEIPMKLTAWGTSALNERAIWPFENEFDVELKKLTDLKLERNNLVKEPQSGVVLNRPFSRLDGNNKMTIIGTPTLSSVKVIMIGVRNPKQSLANTSDDGLPKSVEVWINELRLFDFDNEGGWAATGRVNAQLADLGNLTLAGLISTAGFGSIEEKVNERSQEDLTSYDVSTNLQLGKFFPENWGLMIPMHFSYSEIFANPKYNPLNPDILFEDDLNALKTKEERDELREMAQDYQRRKSINFTNVSRNRLGGGKSRLYSIDNFDFTYAYTEILYRNIDFEYDRQAQYRVGLGYNFMTTPKNVKPLSSFKFLRRKSLSLIRDFNFNYVPSIISFRNEINRGYAESLMRAKSSGIIILEPNYVKTFDWTRSYNVNYDLTQAIKIEYSATNQARIDEPPGSISSNDKDYYEKRDSILQSLQSLGRPTMFSQRLVTNYNIPINKLPLLDWVTANAGYTADYDWQGAPLSALELGNTIQNAQNIRLNFNANFVNLYNKIEFLKKINQKGTQRGRQQQQRPARPSPRDKEEDKKPEEPPQYTKLVFEGFLRVLMSVRNVSFTYNETNGTRLPGFNHSPQFFGQDWELMAPGTGFIFGLQDDIRPQAVREGWITLNEDLNTAYMTNHSNSINARALVEPVPNMKLDLTAIRNYSNTHTEYFKADSLGNFDTFSPVQTGNFSISFLAFNSTFEKVDTKTYSSENFDNFKDYRLIIALRLADENPNASGARDSLGYPVGYGATSQDVLIPAFLAAYGGSDPNKSSLNPFLKIPMPNWRLTYDGLSKIKALQKYFRNIVITHGYISTFSIGQYTSDIRFREIDGYQAAMDVASGNYIPEFEIGQVSIQEQFNPLFNIDVTWQNSLITKVEYKQRRDIGLSFANNQITDLSSNEFIIGTGYRFQNVSFSVIQAGGSGRQQIQSDLVARLNVSFRDSKTILRKITEEQDIISAGQSTISINFSVDYQISPRVNFRFFFDRVVNTPYISNQYKNSNTHGGFSLRFMLI